MPGTELGTLELWLWRPGTNSTFSPPNRTRWAHQKAGTLSSVDMRTCHNSLFLATKVQKLSSHWARHPCGVWMATRHQSHFQGAKVRKTSSHQARYPWGMSLPNCRCIVKRLVKDFWTIAETINKRLLNDCLTIIKGLLNDCWKIIKRLLKDGWTIVKWCWTIVEKLLHNC